MIGSVQRAMRLLEAVAEREHGAPAKQLARDAGLALPTAYHLLRTLTHEGYLHRSKGLFFLGEAVERLSRSSAKQKRRTTVVEALAQVRDTIGIPVHLAMYREGEIEIMPVTDALDRPTTDEWADVLETGRAHAIGQCLLSQLGEGDRRDRQDQDPKKSITPNTVCDDQPSSRRLSDIGRTEPAGQRQECGPGTVCAAIPVTLGAIAATMAVSVPLHQADRLLPAVRQLRDEVGQLSGALDLSISI
nr:helix-turn-helix domain-containing protein [Streptomyces poonensis]